jgi:hypothetical protein
MVYAALRGLTKSPALERHVNLALSMTVGSLGPSACLLIWSFYKVVVVVEDIIKDLGGGRVWVVEVKWLVRTCVPRWLASTNTAVHCRHACL